MINFQSTNYNKLVRELNELKSKEEIIYCISEYVLQNVKYNYLLEDNKKINEFYNFINQKEDNPFNKAENYEDKEQTESMFYSLCDKLGISTDYRMKMNEKYEKLIDSNKEELEFFDFLPSVKTAPVIKNDILKEGVAIDIAKFVKRLCDDTQVPCELVKTKENPDHVWNVVELDGEKLNFDFTYAIFARDKHNDMEKMSEPKDWLGVVDKDMASLYALREINEKTL